MNIGDNFKDYCYMCHNNVQHKLIAYNRFDNPVYVCMVCGNYSVDEINEQTTDFSEGA